MQDVNDAANYLLNSQVKKAFYLYIVRSKLSTEYVIDMLKPEILPSHLLTLLVQAGRDKSTIFKSSIFSEAQKKAFNELVAAGFNQQALGKLEPSLVSMMFRMAILSGESVEHLKQFLKSCIYRPSLHHIIFAFHAKVPNEILVMMAKATAYTARIVGVRDPLPENLPYQVVEVLAQQVDFLVLEQLVNPDILGKYLVRMFEGGQLPVSYFIQILKDCFSTGKFDNSAMLDQFLRLKNSKPFFQYHIFSSSDLSDRIAKALVDTLSIDALLESIDVLDHLGNSGDDKDAKGRRTLKPYLLRRIALQVDGIQRLRRLGYDRFFVGIFESIEFYNAVPSHKVPSGSFYLANPRSIVHSFCTNSAVDDYRRFILLDHIVQNIEMFEGICLDTWIEGKGRPSFDRTIQTYVNFMTPQERTQFLEKSNRSIECKLASAIQLSVV
jgi:hypothetical protein